MVNYLKTGVRCILLFAGYLSLLQGQVCFEFTGIWENGCNSFFFSFFFI